MNKKQLFLMWVGIGIIVLMGIFPPFIFREGLSNRFVGYGFIAPHPQDYDYPDISEKLVMGTIDFTRLLTQWGMVSAITTGFIITFKDKKDNPS